MNDRRQKTLVIIAILLAALVVAGAILLAKKELPPSSTETAHTELQVFSDDLIRGIDAGEPEDEVKTIIESGGRSLTTHMRKYSDVGGYILLTDESTQDTKFLGSVSAGYEDETVVWSPDKKHLFVATEARIIVVDASTLAYRTVFEPQVGTLHGTLTEFPSFVPAVRWVGNTSIEVSIYAAGKLYSPKERDAVVPLERRLISI